MLITWENGDDPEEPIAAEDEFGIFFNA